MSAIDDVVHANNARSPHAGDAQAAPPRRRLAVVTCMDARLDLLDGFGLHLGDAHFLRNAGGIPTEDVLRSLALSQRYLGTREVMIIHHTQCGMDGFDDEAFRSALTAETGAVPPWNVPGFTDLIEDVKRSVHAVRTCPWLPHRDQVRGFLYDVATGTLTPVD